MLHALPAWPMDTLPHALGANTQTHAADEAQPRFRDSRETRKVRVSSLTVFDEINVLMETHNRCIVSICTQLSQHNVRIFGTVK